MRRWLPSVAFALIWAAPAAAIDMPERKAGLWELKMTFEGGNLPPQTVEHCIDAETDKLMSATGGSMVQDMCSKPDVQKDRRHHYRRFHVQDRALRHQLPFCHHRRFQQRLFGQGRVETAGAGNPRDARGADHDGRREVDGRLQSRPETRRHDHGWPQDQRPRSAEYAGTSGCTCKAGRAGAEEVAEARRVSGAELAGTESATCDEVRALLDGAPQGDGWGVRESAEISPTSRCFARALSSPRRQVRFP